jgi:AraC-like DNA-binding protein
VRDAFQGSTLPALFALEVIDEASRRGAQRQAMLSAAGLSGGELASPEAPIPLRSVLAVWEAAMRAVRDPGLPIAVAKRFSIEQYPVLGFAVMTAPTVREAIQRVVRFGALVSDSGKWELEEREEAAHLTWVRAGPLRLGHRVANESAIAEFFHAARQVIGPRAAALAVSFRHPKPEAVSAHQQHFGVRPAWGAPADKIVLPLALLDAAPRLANPALSDYFVRLGAERLKSQQAEETLQARVARTIAEELADGEPSLTRVARRLGLAERTLRRELSEEGVPFRALVESVRRERAEVLLKQAVSLAEIAFSLGFSDLSAFSRAFKRWTGRAPSQARGR